MRKGRDGEWNGKNGMENNGENSGPLTSLQVDRLTATDCNAAARAKIKTFLVATNVVASRPPERRPTATSTAGAKICEQKM